MTAIIWTLSAGYFVLWLGALFIAICPSKSRPPHRPLFRDARIADEREQLQREAVKLAEEMKQWPTSTEQIVRATKGEPLAPLSEPPAPKSVLKPPDKWELETGWSAGWKEPPRTVANMMVGEHSHTTHRALWMKDSSSQLFISRDAPIGTYHPIWRPVAISRLRDAGPGYEWQVRFVIDDYLSVRYPQLTGGRG